MSHFPGLCWHFLALCSSLCSISDIAEPAHFQLALLVCVMAVRFLAGACVHSSSSPLLNRGPYWFEAERAGLSARLWELGGQPRHTHGGGHGRGATGRDPVSQPSVTASVKWVNSAVPWVGMPHVYAMEWLLSARYLKYRWSHLAVPKTLSHTAVDPLCVPEAECQQGTAWPRPFASRPPGCAQAPRVG